MIYIFCEALGWLSLAVYVVALALQHFQWIIKKDELKNELRILKETYNYILREIEKNETNTNNRAEPVVRIS